MLAAVVAAADPWIRWDWVGGHADDIGAAFREHVELTGAAVALGLAVTVPLSLLAIRWRRLSPALVATTGVIYTVPSLALFALLVPYTGLSRATALVGLVGYTLLVLLRNVLAGVDAVPAAVLDAASGMGFSRGGRLWRVELPLAVPSIVAGVRIATVTTIGLVTVTALIGQGGLGRLILDGFTRDFRTPLVVGSVLSVALAVVADLALLAAQRLLTPWSRRGA